jgi:GxxExxY protein
VLRVGAAEFAACRRNSAKVVPIAPIVSPKDPKFPKQRFRSEPSLAVEALATRVIGAAIEVHRHLGSGYLEVIYERAMTIELRERGIEFERQTPIGVIYKGHAIGDHRIDLLVGGELVVELKAVDVLAPYHVSQVLSYLTSNNLDLGLLLNFGAPTMTAGIRRVIR